MINGIPGNNSSSEFETKSNEAYDNVDVSKYPLLKNEAARLESLHSYHILDTAEDKDFDDLTILASVICQTPIALISLVDQDRQWFKAHTGLDARETPRDQSFCAHAIASPDHMMIVPNAKLDTRFANNPLVTGELDITFYAGVPLVNSDGFALGSLCVIDQNKRELTASQIEALSVIAKQVVDKLELRRTLKELEAANTNLKKVNADLHQAHDNLNKEEHRFRNLVQAAPVAIAILRGDDFIIESANEQMLLVWKKDNSVINNPVTEILPHAKHKPYFQFLKGVYKHGKTYHGFEEKIPVYNKQSQLEDHFFNFVYQALHGETGPINGILIVATDVTEQVLSRKEVDESNEHLELALEAGKLGSYELDVQTGLMFCNEQCKANYGLQKDAIFNFTDLVNAILPEYRDYAQEQLNMAIVNKNTYQTEYQVAWPDGRRQWISIFGTPRYDEEGNITKMVGVTQNVSDRKEFDQRKDDFLGIASHELKTPLTSLKASLQLLNKLKENPNHPILPKLIEASNKSVDKMDNLVDDLLNINRFGEGHLNLNKTIFNVANMLNLCCNHVRLAGNHELIVQGDELIKVYADENRIDQVVVNLVNNAVKYAANSKEIYLIITKENGYLKIAVKDNGPGIPEEQIPHLFDRYWRADHTGRNYSGLGLGLFICAEIIKRHDGEIGVTSQLGEGSTFWFTLPLN